MEKDKHEIIKALEKRPKFKIKKCKKIFAKIKGKHLGKKGEAVITEFVEARIAEFKDYCYGEKNFLISEVLDYYLMCRDDVGEKPVYKEISTSSNTVADKRQNKKLKLHNEKISREYAEKKKSLNEGKMFISKCEEITNNLVNGAREEIVSYIHDILSGAAKYINMSIDNFDFTLEEVDYIEKSVQEKTTN